MGKDEREVTELKQCPFCGGTADISQYCKNGIRIKCRNCHIKKEQKVLRYSLEWLRAEMIKDWNTRFTTTP